MNESILELADAMNILAWAIMDVASYAGVHPAAYQDILRQAQDAQGKIQRARAIEAGLVK